MITKNQKFPNVIKADGTREQFDPAKLESSLRRSNASASVVEQVMDHTLKELGEGMTTAQIYKHAFFTLHKLEKPAARRYSLRKAVMDLGPTGFPFEKYIAEVFKERGYTTLTGQIIEGACASHEVDVVAWNDSKLIMVEAKFHNELGMKSDLKVALYVKARFDDIAEKTYFYGKRRSVDEAWLVTNTKFTSAAIEYGMCKGLTMVGWNFPEKNNLQTMIEDGSLHPITCLTSISKKEIVNLVSLGIVLCRQMKGRNELAKSAGLTQLQINDVMEEIEQM